jgi:hypothetical protein
MLDLDAIKTRWAGKRWTYERGPRPNNGTHPVAMLHAGTFGKSIALEDASDAEHGTLELASHAPADVQALLEEVERLRAACQAMIDACEGNDWSEPGISDELYEAKERLRAALGGEVQNVL